MRKGTSQPTMLSGAAPMPLPPYREPAGGRLAHAPEFINRSVEVGPDRFVSITTRWTDNRPVYVVRLVDSRNHDHRDPEEFPTPLKARNAANRLYTELTEEQQ